MNRRRFVASAAWAAALIASPTARAQVATPLATPVATPAATPIATPVADGLQVRFLDMITIPNDLEVGGTLVGGISGLDYDATNDVWYFLSDDRSDFSPARFYTGNISYNDAGFEDVSVDEVVTLLQGDGTEFPNSETGGNVPDPEAIRKDPNAEVLWWTSEGSYDLDIDPFVAISSPDGATIATYPMAAPYAMEYPVVSGPRNNLVFEGLTFASDGASVWIGMEGPLYQDGPIPSLENGAVVRLINMDRSGTIQREAALELLAFVDVPEGTVEASSGITELLALDEKRLLALLRASAIDADNNYTNLVQLLEVDLSNASDVRELPSLVDAEYVPAAATVVIDFNDVIERVDNLEAITFGPDLPNGNRALVVASDNNFNVETQITQFILLEVVN